MPVPPPQESIQYQYEMIQNQMRMNVPSLSSVISKENVLPLLNDDSVVNRLLPLLPSSQNTKEDLILQLSCPQFIQCLKKLTYSLDQAGFFSLVVYI